MEFTFQRLAKQGKIVNVSLLPEIENNEYNWQIDDKDILRYNFNTRQFRLDIYEFSEDEGDWEYTRTLNPEDSKQVAIDNNIIS